MPHLWPLCPLCRVLWWAASIATEAGHACTIGGGLYQHPRLIFTTPDFDQRIPPRSTHVTTIPAGEPAQECAR